MASVLNEKGRKVLFNATGLAFLFVTALDIVPVSSLVLVGTTAAMRIPEVYLDHRLCN